MRLDKRVGQENRPLVQGRKVAGGMDNQKVIVALDFPGKEQGNKIIQALAGSGCWTKVGLELYAHEGPAIVRELKSMGFPVFLDLKLHDIPNTVVGAVRTLAGLEPDMLDVHCSGGYDMMARAVEAAQAAERSTGKRPLMIGVTVLTSMSEEILKSDLGVSIALEEQVLSLARLAQRAGMDGVVASAKEAALLREALGPEFIIITPGIRPAWSEKNDQVRVVTPKEALAAGSTYLVVGRPITGAADPKEALGRLWE